MSACQFPLPCPALTHSSCSLPSRGELSDKPWEVPVAAQEDVDARVEASRSAAEQAAAERRALWETREAEKVRRALASGGARVAPVLTAPPAAQARLRAVLAKPPTWEETHVPPIAARSRELRELAWADREQYRIRRTAATKAEEELRAEAKAAREAEASEREARAAARAKGSKGKKK